MVVDLNSPLVYEPVNPKKRGFAPFGRYEVYKAATTISEFFGLSGTLKDLKHDEVSVFVDAALTS